MELNLSERVSKALSELGFRGLTEVQRQAIPFILQGEDVIVQSRTGTGKTAAFGIPLIELVSSSRVVEALVLVPTRELAIQVGNELRRIGKFSGVRVLVAYGGTSIEEQVTRLREGVNVVVGTPGRIIDLIERSVLSLSGVKYFVLDEADVMLAMGFFDDVEFILSKTPVKKQVLLFCVDLPENLFSLAKKHMRYPQHVKLVSSDVSAQGVKQFFCLVESGKKLGALVYLINELRPSRAIVFCRTKKRVEELTRQLEENGVLCKGIQGDQTQARRSKTMQEFKSGKLRVLVATDVAARGIHVERVSHVFNYELPHDLNYYVHRIGRTGRMNEVGQAISLCYPDELSLLNEVEELIGKKIEEMKIPASIPVPKFVGKKSFGNRKHFLKKSFSRNRFNKFRDSRAFVGQRPRFRSRR